MALMHAHGEFIAATDTPAVKRSYAWVVFALTFGLLLSDYMSRQVLNAVFPVLKAEWQLSDAQLGSLSGIVALLVGLLTVPLSVLADRFGRVRSVIIMAALWSLATLACGLASNYGDMFVARFLVGVGEAAYGSVGVALLIAIFPPHMRATLTGAFMAGGAIGSVVGIVLGGAVATKLGWRNAFFFMAALGFVLVTLYFIVVTENRLGGADRASKATARIQLSLSALVRGLFGSRSLCLAYVGSGLQLFILAAMMAWLPSYLNRYYQFDMARAGATAGMFILIAGVGMAVCGIVADRLARKQPERAWRVNIAYALVSGILLALAFRLPPGTPQMALIALGLLTAGGASGPSGAIVANLTQPVIHASAFAMLTLVNNLLGLAPGPYLTGVLADQLGLLGALQFVPFMGVAAAGVFYLGSRTYLADMARLRASVK